MNLLRFREERASTLYPPCPTFGSLSNLIIRSEVDFGSARYIWKQLITAVFLSRFLEILEFLVFW